MNIIYCLALALLLPFAQSSARVANYSVGRAGSMSYEHFSFWIKDGKLEASYSYGPGSKELPLSYKGVESCEGAPCFKVVFPNGRALYIRPAGMRLKVTDQTKRYSKVFRWEYEGPQNGVGTFCSACAEDEKEAIQLIKKHYL